MAYQTIFFRLSWLSILLMVSGLCGVMAQQPFEKLAHEMHLKTPKLREGEYEIRIWNKQGLVFGVAHSLYMLRKTKRGVKASAYSISWNKSVFKKAKKYRSTSPVSDSLWNQLLNDGILTLPSEAAIDRQLRPPQPKDSTWTTVEPDGSVSVKARKWEGYVLISDGEGYYFDVYGANQYRRYEYSNPKEYHRAKPEIIELQKVVAILNTVAALFY